MRPHFYLLRHGETVWNRIGRLQGQIDVPLTRLGLIQAEAMGRTLSEILETGEQSGPVRMIASPLGRARGRPRPLWPSTWGTPSTALRWSRC